MADGGFLAATASTEASPSNPKGSTWTHPNIVEALYAGQKGHNRITKGSSDPYVHPQGKKSFRETAQMSWDELPVGNGFGFNYGAEPGSNQIAQNPTVFGEFAGQLAHGAIGEETSLFSWTYGDPPLGKLASGKGSWLPTQRGSPPRIAASPVHLFAGPRPLPSRTQGRNPA